MISIAKYQLVQFKDNINKYYVKSQENSICPTCENMELKVVGSRSRTAWNGDGKPITLVIRRLRCINGVESTTNCLTCLCPTKGMSVPPLKLSLMIIPLRSAVKTAAYPGLKPGLPRYRSILPEVCTP